MAEFKVVEIFESINGEGMRAGELAVFVRFAYCNLDCSYCDTVWACRGEVDYEIMTENDICEAICKKNIKNITLTGGEPLIQPDIDILIKKLLMINNIRLEIETNGSRDITKYFYNENISMTVDYKLPGSHMEEYMFLKNFEYIRIIDTVKFVVGDIDDLMKSKNVIDRYGLREKCNIIFSPVFGRINPIEIVDFMKENSLNDIRLQLQLHKYIWNPDEKGV